VEWNFKDLGIEHLMCMILMETEIWYMRFRFVQKDFLLTSGSATPLSSIHEIYFAYYFYLQMYASRPKKVTCAVSIIALTSAMYHIRRSRQAWPD
jgi:hypothetical protein